MLGSIAAAAASNTCDTNTAANGEIVGLKMVEI